MVRRAHVIGLCLLLALAGCRQILGLDDLVDAGTTPPDDVMIDAEIDAMPIPDAGTCTGVSAECLGKTLRTCSAAGEMPTDLVCSFTCSTAGTAHCGALSPAGGAALPNDLTPSAALMPITLTVAGTSINTDNGAIDNGVRGSGNGIINGIGYATRNNIAIFFFESLTVNAPITIRGSRPVVLLATGSITVGQPIDVRGTCGSNGNPGPGGGNGGNPANNGTAMTGNGAGGGAGGNSTNGSAGAGAGHGALGGTGGKAAGTNPAGGAVYSDAAITTLSGGSGGGGGVGSISGHGGGGGGGLQLVANTTIHVSGTGGINAGGCGGVYGYFAGGGGGSGGTILIESGTVQLDTGAYLAVNGGGGGGSGGGATGGTDGGNGGATAARAAAGAHGMTGGPGGGDGGRGGASGALAGEAGMDHANAGGGGGGSVGRIRINTLSGTVGMQAGVVMSPSLTDAPTSATAGMVAVQ